MVSGPAWVHAQQDPHLQLQQYRTKKKHWRDGDSPLSPVSVPGVATTELWALSPQAVTKLTTKKFLQVDIRKSASHLCLVRDGSTMHATEPKALDHGRSPSQGLTVGVGMQPDSLAPLGLSYSRRELGKGSPFQL